MTEINFSELRDPDKFSRFMNQLLNLKFDAIAIRPPNDRGRDSYEVRENGGLKIYQYKYFLNAMNHAQKTNVKESLKTALDNFPDCKDWALCLPREITSTEELFLDGLAKEHKIIVSFVGEAIIKNWCHETSFPLDQYFDSHMHIRTDEKITEILAHVKTSKKGMNFTTINKVVKDIIETTSAQVNGSSITIPIDIKKKIETNGLSSNFEQILLKQMTKFSQIDSYLKSGVLKAKDIDNMLVALKGVYIKFKEGATSGDDIFVKMVEELIPQNATEEDYSAYCALICYFFHSCEVFENVVTQQV